MCWPTYARWLEKKYGTVESLNQAWYTPLRQFADVRPPEDPRARGGRTIRRTWTGGDSAAITWRTSCAGSTRRWIGTTRAADARESAGARPATCRPADATCGG